MLEHADLLFDLVSKQKKQIFKCKHCHKTEESSDKLKQHVMNSHTKVNPGVFQCHECNFKAPTSQLWSQHMVSRHSQTQSVIFRCYDCDYKAPTTEQLNHHVLTIHNQDQSDFPQYVSCKLCYFKTRSESGMKAHYKMVHIQNPTKKFMCVKCDSVFSLKRELTLHSVNSACVSLVNE